MTPEQIGEYLEHQGATDDEIDEFLEHFGVKGMKWGVRRQQSRDARSARLNAGTATRRDKYIREMDLDGGRTEQIKKGAIPKPSKASKALFGVAAAASIGFLGYQVAGVLKERQQLSKAYSSLRQMPDKERAEVGKRLLKNLNLNTPEPRSFPSYKNELKSLQDAHKNNMRDLNLPEPSIADLANAARKLGIKP